MASAGSVPPDETQKNLIDKVAQYVAKNGTEFEEMMRKKQQGNGEYSFLSTTGYRLYNYQKLNQQREAATQAARDAVVQSHQSGWNPPAATPLAKPPVVNKWNPTLKIGGWSNPNSANTGWVGHTPIRPAESKVQPWGKHGAGAADLGGSGGWKPEQHEQPPVTQTQIGSMRDEYNSKKADFDSKIKESDGNLKEQRKSLMTDKENRVDQVIEEKLIFECSRDALKIDLNLDEFHRILRPIVKHCTKEAIATGKAWILHNARDTTTARLICRYISARVLSNSATFDMRLHTIYLINDVLHHANRKSNKTILGAFEEMIIPLWSVAKLRADKEIGERLSKLKDLWKQNAYFGQETERRFESHIVEYKQFRDDLRERYKDEVKKAEDEFDGQFRDYEKQHTEYVAHTGEVLTDLEKGIKSKENELNEWEVKMEKKRKEEHEQMKRNQEGLENYKKELSARAELNMQGQNTNFGPLGKKWEGNEDGLIPKRKYFELPAGLMAACIPLSQKPFTEIDPQSLRLVPHIQPSKKLLNAIDDFYRPIPPHLVMKDNWIQGCLDPFFEAKTAALENILQTRRDSKDDSNEAKRPQIERVMEEDVYPYTRHAVMVAVAKLAQSVGFQGANAQPLNVLADLMDRYIHLVGTKTMEYAEHAQHNQADHIDVFAALKDMGTQPHSLRNLIDFTEPLVPADVPKIPKAKGKILGLNETNEIDEQTPEFVYPWMPSISAARRKDAEMKRLREQEAKKENEKDASDDEFQMENPPSAPGGARGADHHYPTVESDADVSSYPATPATPAVAVAKLLPIPKESTPPPKIESTTESKINSLFSPESTTSSPIQRPPIQSPIPIISQAPPVTIPDKKPPPVTDKKPAPVPDKRPPPVTVSDKRPPPVTVPDKRPPPILAAVIPTAVVPTTVFPADSISSSSSEDPVKTQNLSYQIESPPGFDSDPESEPPGITDDSSESDVDTVKPPKLPVAPVAATPALPRPTSPKATPVEAGPRPFDSDEERRTKKARKELKKEKKAKKKEKKAKKKEEKEKRKKEKKEKGKKEKKKKKHQSRERSTDDSDDSDASTSSAKTPIGKLTINLQQIMPKNLGPDGQPRKRGRPPKPKPKKEIKPRGRPPKDPKKAAEKLLQAQKAAQQAERDRLNQSSSSTMSEPKSEPKVKKESSRAEKPSREQFTPVPKKEPPVKKPILSAPIVKSESSSDDLSDDEPVIAKPKPKPKPPPKPPQVVPTVKIPPKTLPPPIPVEPPIPTVKIPPPVKSDKKRQRSPEPEVIKPTIKIKPPKQESAKVDMGEPPKKKINKEKKPIKSSRNVEPLIKKIVTPVVSPPQIKPQIKPPIAKVIEKQKEKKEEKKKVKVKDVVKPPVVKKEEVRPFKVKSFKEVKKEEKKAKEPKVEAATTVTTATTVTVTTGTTDLDNKPYLVTNSDGNQVVAYFDENSVWICPKCGKEDDGSEMIGCDKCPDWYHNSCVGIIKVPEGSWFCPNCQVLSQLPSKNKKKKMSKKKS